MLEARNLRNMTAQQTPLLGDENTPMHTVVDGGTGFESATPRHQVAFTPNPLATPRPGGAPNGSVAGTPLRTPMRDNLDINPIDGNFIGDTPRDVRIRQTTAKRTLKASFMSLPVPENNFELLVPEDEEAEDESAPLSVEDAAERDARLARLRAEAEARELARRSQSVQRGLPRPPNVDLTVLLNELQLIPVDETEDEQARRLIDSEVAQLMLHDSLAHPLPGTTNPGSTLSDYVSPPDEDVAAATAEVARELGTLVGFPDAPETQIRDGIIAIAANEEIDESVSWARVRPTLAFDADERVWKDPATLSVEARIAGWGVQLEEARAAMAREGARAGKVEKKLGVVLGGYLNRSKDLSVKLGTTYNTFVDESIDKFSFERLKAREDAAGPARVAALREDTERLQIKEKSLQGLYAELEREKNEAEQRVAILEERVMMEAEALNEAAMQQESS